uniref:Uncharacterized protein n=1 Tax=Hanusia phi TaxID=3032 RepID=A0A7S0HI68_9CRYP
MRNSRVFQESLEALQEQDMGVGEHTRLVDVTMIDLWGWRANKNLSLLLWSRSRLGLQFDIFVGRTSKSHQELLLSFNQDSECFDLSVTICNLLVEAQFGKDERFSEMLGSLVLLPHQ